MAQILIILILVDYLTKNDYQIIRIGNQGMDQNPFGDKINITI